MKGATRRRVHGAFTILELVIVMLVIGIIAAMAIPSFMLYVRRARATEALQNVPRIFNAAMAYFEVEHSTRSGTVPALHLPETSPAVPTYVPGADVYAATVQDWDDASWQALAFTVATPMRYRYQYCLGVGHHEGHDCIDGTMEADKTRFEVVAVGDLNGNGVFSLIVREARGAGGPELRPMPLQTYSLDE